MKAPVQKPTRGRQPAARTYSKHGLTTLKHAVKALGSRTIDMRTSLGKALMQWREDLMADLGGAEVVTTQQAAVIDLAVKTKLMLDSIDAWTLQQPSLINKRARAVLPVVRERQQIADALARYMQTLGLERRVPNKLQTLHEVVREIEREKAAGTTNGATAHPSSDSVQRPADGDGGTEPGQ
jgi:hypothetical protein